MALSVAGEDFHARHVSTFFLLKGSEVERQVEGVQEARSGRRTIGTDKGLATALNVAWIDLLRVVYILHQR